MHWIARYSDGTSLNQFEGDREHRYQDIDRSRLIAFVVMNGDSAALVCHIPKDGRLIYRQRVEKRPGKREVRVWLVGCQTTRNGVNAQYIAAIFPDGSVEIVDCFREGHPWFYSPTPHPHEGETWDMNGN